MAKSKYSAETKLTALGKMQDPECDLRTIGEELKVGYGTLLGWKRELALAQENGFIQDLVNVDEVVVQKIAQEVKEDLVELVADKKDIEEIEEAIEGTLESIDGYKALDTTLQDVAIKLAEKILVIVDNTATPESLLVLVEALTKLQVSFFNKPVASISVTNNQKNVSNTQVNQFSSLQNKA